jgi:hypothetical protein
LQKAHSEAISEGTIAETLGALHVSSPYFQVHDVIPRDSGCACGASILPCLAHVHAKQSRAKHRLCPVKWPTIFFSLHPPPSTSPQRKPDFHASLAIPCIFSRYCLYFISSTLLHLIATGKERPTRCGSHLLYPN